MICKTELCVVVVVVFVVVCVEILFSHNRVLEYIIGVCAISFPLLFQRILGRRPLLMRS